MKNKVNLIFQMLHPEDRKILGKFISRMFLIGGLSGLLIGIGFSAVLVTHILTHI